MPYTSSSVIIPRLPTILCQGLTQHIYSVPHSSWDSNCVVHYIVAAQCRADTALTSCCSGGGPRQPWSSGLAPVSSLHSSSSPLPPLSPSLIGHLISVDVRQTCYSHSEHNFVDACRPTLHWLLHPFRDPIQTKHAGGGRCL